MASAKINTKSWVVISPKVIVSLLIGSYLIFIAYGSLYPAHPWQRPSAPISYLLTVGWLDNIQIFDILQNLLFYMPIGALWGYNFPGCKARSILTLLATTLCLSTGLEITQSFLPMRYPSILDILLNVSGAILAYVLLHQQLQLKLKFILEECQISLLRTFAGCGVIGVFIIAQWMPFIPTLEPTHIINSLNPILSVLSDPHPLDISSVLRYAIWGIATFLGFRLAFNIKHYLRSWVGLITIIMFIKIFIITRVVSFEAVTGLLLSYTLIGFVSNLYALYKH
jgi:hypothetical protein